MIGEARLTNRMHNTTLQKNDIPFFATLFGYSYLYSVNPGRACDWF
jgi:hypothetical protein